jgi:glycosyltransferase involved in cell wall biosynthesis
MKRIPRVTACIPVYNNARFLSEAIESVRNQNFTDFELLILDDCSSDGSREIIRGHAAQDTRIVAAFHDRNLGMVENWNACLDRAKGEYVKFLFGDDLLASKDTLSQMVTVLDAEHEISLVASARNIIDEYSQNVKVASSFPHGLVMGGTGIINRCLLTQKNLIGEPSVVMFRKSQAERRFNGRYSQLVDLEMWFHLLEQGKFSYIGKPLASFRVHEGQQTRKNVRDMVHIEEMFALLEEFGAKPYVTLGALTKRFLQYRQSYRIWKAYKCDMISRDQALTKISRHCPPWKFMALIPLYKIANPVWKLRCRMSGLSAML